MEETEDEEQARRVTRRAWSFATAGLVLLVGGSAAMVLLGQPTQRIVLAAGVVPLLVAAWTTTIRQVLRERRDGQQPPPPEAARRAPLLTVGTALFGWGLAFAGFQAANPEPDVTGALLQGAPFAIITLAGLGPVWALRRTMRREERGTCRTEERPAPAG